MTSPHKCYLEDFLKGVPEPSTGEVLEDGTIDIRIGAEGWTESKSGFRNKKSGGKRTKSSKFVVDPTGQYIHPWYFQRDKFKQTKVEVLKAA